MQELAWQADKQQQHICTATTCQHLCRGHFAASEAVLSMPSACPQDGDCAQHALSSSHPDTDLGGEADLAAPLCAHTCPNP